MVIPVGREIGGFKQNTFFSYKVGIFDSHRPVYCLNIKQRKNACINFAKKSHVHAIDMAYIKKVTCIQGISPLFHREAAIASEQLETLEVRTLSTGFFGGEIVSFIQASEEKRRSTA